MLAGDGFALHAAKVTEFEGNTAHHNAHSGVLHSPNTHGGCALGAAVPVGAPAPLDLPASSLTAVGNGQQQVCASMQDLGVFYAKVRALLLCASTISRDEYYQHCCSCRHHTVSVQ